MKTPEPKKGIIARLRALPPLSWFGAPGKKFRRPLVEYTENHAQASNHLEEVPDLIWSSAEGLAHEKRAKATKDYAGANVDQVHADLAHKTMEDKRRQEAALADKMETEARIVRIQEVNAQLDLVEKCRAMNAIPKYDEHGNLKGFVKAPAGYDWDGLKASIASKGTEPVDPQPEDDETV